MNTLEETVVVNQVERKAGRQSTLLKTLPAVVLGAGLLLSPMAFADGAKEGETTTPAQQTEQSASGADTTSAIKATEEKSTKDADKAKVGNPEIEKLLNEEGIKFRYTEDGEYRMLFAMDGDRSQLVFIDPTIYTLEDYKTFNVYSVAYCGRITKPMAMELLQPWYKVGYWRIQKVKDTDDTFLVAFYAQVPSTISAKDLRSCIQKVTREADALERDWTDVDVR